jgi:hypothetical protein
MVLDAAPRMAVLQGTLGDRTNLDIENDKDAERLTILPNSAVAKMPVRNLPLDVRAEYIARLPNGTRLLVTRTTEESGDYSFRVFLGPEDAVAERTVASVTRQREGGRTITFDVDGAQARGVFPLVVADGGTTPGDATITVGDVTTSLTLEEIPPDNATYLCR